MSVTAKSSTAAHRLQMTVWDHRQVPYSYSYVFFVDIIIFIVLIILMGVPVSALAAFAETCLACLVLGQCLSCLC